MSVSSAVPNLGFAALYFRLGLRGTRVREEDEVLNEANLYVRGNE